MKRTNANLIAASLGCVLLFGQTQSGGGTIPAVQLPLINSQNDLTPRGLYISKSADAMRAKVLDAKTGSAVSPTQQFTKDDRITVIIESNFESYAYIVNVEIIKSGEKRFMLYPNPRVTNNRLKPGAPLELSIAFDEKPALEVLQVIVSHDPIDYLTASLNASCSDAENRCLLDSQAAKRVAEIVGDKASSPPAGAAGIFARKADQKSNQSGLKSRDIILAPGKDKDGDEKQTYVAIPIKSGGDARLNAKEVVVFEMRLKHI